MDIGSILIGLAVLILAGFIVSRPLLDYRAGRERKLSEADRWRQERDQVLTALRDLDFDYSLGKLREDDYALLRADLVRRGAEALKQLDATGRASQPAAADEAIEKAIAARRQARAKPAGQPLPVAASDEAIEQAIAARRQSRSKAAGAACPHCGATVRPDDRFCPRCGKPLQLRCPKCDAPAQAGDQFCAKCGTQLTDTPGEVSAS